MVCKQSGDSMCVPIMSVLYLHGLLALPKQLPSELMRNIYLGRKMLHKSVQGKMNTNGCSDNNTEKDTEHSKDVGLGKRLKGKTGVSEVWEQAMQRQDRSLGEPEPSLEDKATHDFMLRYRCFGNHGVRRDLSNSSKDSIPQPSRKKKRTPTVTLLDDDNSDADPQKDRNENDEKHLGGSSSSSKAPQPASDLRTALARAKRARAANAQAGGTK